ncbi:MAG: threonine-phosphate decarboxylase CobD [Pseudomonadota bacterium]
MTADLVHGGALDEMRAQFPGAPAPWIDLSTGINPHPYPDVSISRDALAHLPNAAIDLACRRAMAEAIGTAPDAIVLAPGSELMIRLLPEMLRPRDVAILSPTYGDPGALWRAAGANTIETANPLDIADQVDTVVICNPNNPDGRTFSPIALEAARRTLAARRGWLVVDEAYGDLDPAASLAPKGGADSLVILRSFGKFFGLAGVRLGALIAPKALRAAMADRLGAWPVSGAALEIGARAYRDHDWQAETRKTLVSAAARLESLLRASGLRVIGGTALFQYVQTPDAHALWRHLGRKGLYVRRFAWSQQHLRIGLPPNAESETRLAEALSTSG